MIQDITASKTAVEEKTGARGRAIVSGGADTPARVADLLSGIRAWAVEEEYVETNPVHGVRPNRGEPEERHLREDELRTLGRTFRLSTNSFHLYASKIIILLSLTGCRLNEIHSLQWSEFDIADSRLSPEDSKPGTACGHRGRSIGSIEGPPAPDQLSVRFSSPERRWHGHQSRRGHRFDPRPAKGRPRQVARSFPPSCFDPRPREGATGAGLGCKIGIPVSIHAPAKGATVGLLTFCLSGEKDNGDAKVRNGRAFGQV